MTPTPQEVCRTLELMSLQLSTIEGKDFKVDGDPFNVLVNFIYMMTHIANDHCNNKHEDWVAKFREHQAFWENEDKAPLDSTKVTMPCPKFKF